MHRLANRITREYLEARTQSDSPPYFTDEAIGQIKSYIKPYLDELDTVTTGDFLLIINRYPQKVRDNIRIESQSKGFVLSAADRGVHYNKYSVPQTADAIMNYLMDNIIFGDNDETFNNGYTVNPWDVEIQFRSSEVPRELFHLVPLTDDEEHDQVPLTINVTVIINGKQFVHPMSEQLVRGIIAYYKAFGLQHPLSLGGTTFMIETNEIAPIARIPHSGYTVQVGPMTYEFSDKEFMKGLITANAWVTNDNPHKRISNLKQYSLRNTGGGLPGLVMFSPMAPIETATPHPNILVTDLNY